MAYLCETGKAHQLELLRSFNKNIYKLRRYVYTFVDCDAIGEKKFWLLAFHISEKTNLQKKLCSKYLWKIKNKRTTSSKDSKMSMLGWWIVHTIVRPVFTIFLTVLITMAAALASKPDVGSSMNTIEGLATSSTAIVNLFRCSVDKPSTPGRPTNAPLSGVSSTSSITSSTKACKIPYSNQIVPKSHKNYKIQFIFTRWISKVTSDGNRSQAENRSDSRTVKQGEWISVCSQ